MPLEEQRALLEKMKVSQAVGRGSKRFSLSVVRSGFASCFLRRRLIKNHNPNNTAVNTATPPTTLPAIAPVGTPSPESELADDGVRPVVDEGEVFVVAAPGWMMK